MIVTKDATEIRYCRQQLAEELLFSNWPTHLLSIANPNSAHAMRPLWFEGPHLELEFRDTRNPSDPEAPGVLSVKAIQEFAMNIPGSSKVLIACPGGYSRSSAAAVLIAVLLGNTPEETFAQLPLDNEFATPNPVLLRSAETHCDFDGHLIQCWTSWLHEQGLDDRFFAPLKARKSRR